MVNKFGLSLKIIEFSCVLLLRFSSTNILLFAIFCLIKAFSMNCHSLLIVSFAIAMPWHTLWSEHFKDFDGISSRCFTSCLICDRLLVLNVFFSVVLGAKSRVLFLSLSCSFSILSFFFMTYTMIMQIIFLELQPWDPLSTTWIWRSCMFLAPTVVSRKF